MELNFRNLTVKFDKLDLNLSKFNNKIVETTATLNQKEEVDDLTKRLTECEGRFGDVQKQLLLQTEMLIEQKERFNSIDNNSKSHALIERIYLNCKTPQSKTSTLYLGRYKLTRHATEAATKSIV